MYNIVKFKNAFMFAIPFLVYYFSYSSGLSDIYSLYLAITLWAIYVWMNSIISVTMVSIALPMLYMIFNVAPADIVFLPWSGTVPWLCLSGILLGQMMLKSGLAARIAYKCILLFGDSILKILLGLMFASFIIAPLIPTALAKMALFCAIGVGFCEALKIPDASKESAAIMLTLYISVTGTAYGFLTGCIQVPASIQLMKSVSGINVSFFDYLYHNFIPATIYVGVGFIVMFLVLKPRNIDGITEIITDKYEKLGKISFDEKKAIVVFILTLLYLITDPIHKINAAWGMTFIALMLFMPGIRLLDNSDFEKTNFSMIFFIGGALSIGSVASAIGISRDLANLIGGLFSSGDVLMHAFVSYMMGILTLFFLTPMTGMATMAVPITELAMKINIDPRLMLYSFNYGMDQVLFSYQYALILLLVSYNRVKKEYLFNVLFLKLLATTFIVFPIILCYWKLIGLW